MKIIKGIHQICVISNDESTAAYFWFNKRGILNLGISYDSYKPFRNISINFVFFGVMIQF